VSIDPTEYGAAPVRVLCIDGSPAGGGRTHAALAAVAAAAAGNGAAVETIRLGDADDEAVERAVARVAATEAIVLGAPVYRAAAAAPLKRLLDAVPRSNDDQRDSPFAAKPVAIVHTGASLHHFLALDGLRNVLAGFFAAHVVPPGLYVPRAGFGDDSELLEPYAGQAIRQGAALVALAESLRTSAALRSVRPQA
jgi:FMN reductase